jgi:hypothetical protein
MKYILFIAALTLTLNAYSQKKKNNKDVYNTHIDTAGKVEINGGNTTILKVDTMFIGQLIIDPSITTQVFFWGSTSIKDNNGIYTTTFRFAPKVNPGTFNINVAIEFDSSFIPWYLTDPPPPSNAIVLGRKNHVVDIKDDYGESAIMPRWTTDYKVIIFRGLISADNIYISVKSKTKLYATIHGVAGEAR